MEININNYHPGDELVEAIVRYHEIINGHGYSAQLSVWVPNLDSRSEIRRLAAEEAKKFLERALLAHSS